MQLHSADLKTSDFIVKNKTMSGLEAKRTLDIFRGHQLFYEMEAPDKSGAIKRGLQGRHYSQISGQEQWRVLVRQNSPNPEDGSLFFIDEGH